MGIGDPPTPVASDVEVNHPVPTTGEDGLDQVSAQLLVHQLSGNTELVRQIRFLYDTLSLPYPPP